MKNLLDRHVLFFGGKGGVGKTTCAAATALAASRMGRRVLLVSTDPAHSTSDIFERAIGPEPTELLPSLHAMEIDAGAESRRYVAGVKEHIAKLFGHSILKEANRQIDLAATMPGAEEVALFDRMGALIRGEDPRFDLIIFDTAPTGHTLRLIRMPELMEAWIKALSRSRRAMLGADQDDRQDPIMISLTERLDRLRELRARLVSGRTTGFVLVLIPERLPIEETARAIVQLDEAAVRVGTLDRQSGAARDERRRVSECAPPAGECLPGGDWPAVPVALDRARVAAGVGRVRHRGPRADQPRAVSMTVCCSEGPGFSRGIEVRIQRWHQD